MLFRNKKAKKGTVMGDPVLSNEQKNWLISLSGHLSTQNEESFDGLNMSTPETQFRVNTYKKMLDQSYSVTTKDELISTLDALYNSQSSSTFMACMAEFTRPDLYAKYLSENKSQTYQGSPLGIMSGWAETHTIPLARGGIRAFDIGRYAFLCRCGVTVNLLTEAEAWHYLIKIGRLAQSLFVSWHGFAGSYVVGRCIWQKIESKDPYTESDQAFNFSYDLFEKINKATSTMQTILADDEHPWCRTEWNQAL